MPTSTLSYQGPERKLAIAFDCGTTYSGISYVILDPGKVPQIRGVTRFPTQEAVGGDSKIPSILYYNSKGEVCAVGAEALQESVIEQAEEEEWLKLEGWKLHLRPKGLASSQINDDDLPPLPAHKTAVDVLSDFMKYLFQCAETFIKDTHSPELWASVADNIDFVLTHPNGWEGAQQAQIRRAAVRAGLVFDSPKGQSRLQLLTEGEARLHFCIPNDLPSDSMTSYGGSLNPNAQDGRGIIIVDAGESTIDLSAYYISNTPARIEEIAPTEYRLEGSMQRAHGRLAEKLAGSKYGSPEDLANMTSCFDKTTKLRFRNPDELSYIKFGGVRDKDPEHTLYTGASGQQLIHSEQGARISEDREFRQTYCQTRRKKELDKVDTAEMTNASQALYGPEGVIFYQLDLSVVLQFGINELKAKLCWNEDGEEKQIPARVVYDSELWQGLRAKRSSTSASASELFDGGEMPPNI
ncbi:hypothetical protein FIBSPDRAFT_903144 [Athelia psychrophila]|uniref:Actin-like ATPase domain-containing protein n=1 Tax=Athelia psychrophila TaxID=1759441 RepID=A0A167WDM6_9AGAM|nr:hypothetical protein FIBSPDRAFT_903144 [Fibularhizoctonia sp. CBS 109695]